MQKRSLRHTIFALIAFLSMIFVFTTPLSAQPNTNGTRIEFVGPTQWQEVRFWAWHTGGANFSTEGWSNAPRMTWDNDVSAWVFIVPDSFPAPFNLILHNGAGAQTPTWTITGDTRILWTFGDGELQPILPTVPPNNDTRNVNRLVFANPYNLPDTPQGGNMLHAWNMSFNEIRSMLPYIARSGFNSIQTSPIGNSLFQFPEFDENNNPTNLTHLVGTWWMLYQPTRFQIGNMLGTEEEFRALAREAALLGIFIIVDAIPNHTTSWWGEVHPELRRPELFHAIPGDNSIWDRNISNWGDRAESTRARLLGLIDFNTGNSEFQELYLEFLGRKLDAGASGFRYDAMVHIESPGDPEGVRSDFWTVTTNFVRDHLEQLGRPSFQYGEILGGASRQRIYLRDLADDIAVTPYGFGNHIRTNAITRTNNNLATGNAGWNSSNFHIPAGSVEGSTPNGPAAVSSRVVPWVESHDQYGNAGVSRSLTTSQINVGWALIAAREGVTPLFFVRPNNDFVNDGQMFVREADGTYSNAWGHSDHFRSPVISAINWFSNNFIGYPERTSTHASDAGNNVAMIERGASGFGNKTGAVIATTGTQPLTNVALPTYLANGDYFDQISGRRFVVENGILSGPSINPRSVVVLLETPNPDATALLNATPGSLEFWNANGIDVRLEAVNTENQTFTISKNNQVIIAETAFEDGKTITIGANSSPSDVFTLTLSARATNIVNLPPVARATRVEFVGPSNWTQVRFWAWHEGGANFSDNWFTAPLMTWDVEVNAWVFIVPETFPTPFNLILHNGAGSQTPQWQINRDTQINWTIGSGNLIPIESNLPTEEPSDIIERTFTFTRIDQPEQVVIEFVTTLQWSQVGIWTWPNNIASGSWPGTNNQFNFDELRNVWTFTFPIGWATPINMVIHNGIGNQQTPDILNITSSERISWINGQISRQALIFEPVDPNEPIEGEDPEEPGDPVEGEDPEEPGDPVEGEDPEEPGDPVEGEDPEEPGDTIEGEYEVIPPTSDNRLPLWAFGLLLIGIILWLISLKTKKRVFSI